MNLLRPSIWRRTLLVLVVVAGLPVAFVWMAPWYERALLEGEHTGIVRDAVAAALAAPTTDLPAALERVALAHGVRLRVIGPDGAARIDVDHTLDARWADRVGVLGLSPGQRRRLARYDEQLAPVATRDVVTSARAGRVGTGCTMTEDGMVMVCERAVRLEAGQLDAPDGKASVLHAQTGSPRSVRNLYGARYQLLKLAAQVGAVALVLGLWLAWRVRRPIRRLRAEVVARARAPVSTRAVPVPRWAEVAELATAFNTLLDAIEHHRRAKVAFMADVAHDIKNAAATMKACAEALDGEVPPTPDRLARIGRALETSSARVTRLVEQFLELARAEAGLPDARRDPVDLAARLTELVDGRAPRDPPVEFEVQARPAVIEGVGDALDRVWLNLLDNAEHFAGRGGGHVQVTVAPTADGARVMVSDDGPGIEPADRARVFDRYFSRRDDGGSGLGMAIARAIVEAHGGRIEVDASPTGGARFTVTL